MRLFVRSTVLRRRGAIVNGLPPLRLVTVNRLLLKCETRDLISSIMNGGELRQISIRSIIFASTQSGGIHYTA